MKPQVAQDLLIEVGLVIVAVVIASTVGGALLLSQAAANLWFDFNGRGEAIFRVLTRV